MTAKLTTGNIKYYFFFPSTFASLSKVLRSWAFISFNLLFLDNFRLTESCKKKKKVPRSLYINMLIFMYKYYITMEHLQNY